MTDNQNKTATLRFRKQEFEVPSGITIREAILHINMSPESLLVVKDGELVTEERRLAPGDVVKLVATISGG